MAAWPCTWGRRKQERQQRQFTTDGSSVAFGEIGKWSLESMPGLKAAPLSRSRLIAPAFNSLLVNTSSSGTGSENLTSLIFETLVQVGSRSVVSDLSLLDRRPLCPRLNKHRRMSDVTVNGGSLTCHVEGISQTVSLAVSAE